MVVHGCTTWIWFVQYCTICTILYNIVHLFRKVVTSYQFEQPLYNLNNLSKTSTELYDVVQFSPGFWEIVQVVNRLFKLVRGYNLSHNIGTSAISIFIKIFCETLHNFFSLRGMIEVIPTSQINWENVHHTETMKWKITAVEWARHRRMKIWWFWDSLAALFISQQEIRSAIMPIPLCFLNKF